MHKPRVAIIVVTWNSASVIGDLVASLRSSTFDGEVDLIVVDNDSTDGTIDVVRAFDSDATVVATGRNAGYAAGINAGMARAGDVDAYLLLNPDMRLESDSIQPLVDAVASPGVGIAVPRLVDQDGALRYSLRRAPTIGRAWGEALLGGERAGRISALGEVVTSVDAYSAASKADWATGAAMLISRECADAVGRWDESYFLYSEETDFALRAADARFELRYVPDSEFVHHEGESHESASLFMLLTRNRVKLYRTRHGPVKTGLFWLGVFTGEALRFRRPTRRAAARALLGRTDGIASPS